MSDTAKLKIETKESVALELAKEIAVMEDMRSNAAEYRKNFLDLYAECLYATSNHREFDS